MKKISSPKTLWQTPWSVSDDKFSIWMENMARGWITKKELKQLAKEFFEEELESYENSEEEDDDDELMDYLKVLGQRYLEKIDEYDRFAADLGEYFETQKEIDKFIKNLQQVMARNKNELAPIKPYLNQIKIILGKEELLWAKIFTKAQRVRLDFNTFMTTPHRNFRMHIWHKHSKESKVKVQRLIRAIQKIAAQIPQAKGKESHRFLINQISWWLKGLIELRTEALHVLKYISKCSG